MNPFRKLTAWWRGLGNLTPQLPPLTVRRGGLRYPVGTVESVTTDDAGMRIVGTIHDPILAAAVRGSNERVSIATDDRYPDWSWITAGGGWCAPSEVLYDLTRTPRWRLALTWVAFHARCRVADWIDPRAKWTEAGYVDDDDYGQEP